MIAPGDRGHRQRSSIKVLHRIISYFNRKTSNLLNVPKPTFVDADLGELRFIQGIGWTGIVFVDGTKVDVVFCTSGDVPTQEQNQHVLYWMTNWFGCRAELGRFMTSESKRWKATSLPIDWQRDGLPDIDSLELSAIVQNDPFAPAKITIYLAIPGDDYRQFYIQLEHRYPQVFGFDDG